MTRDAERRGVCSHAERGNEVLISYLSSPATGRLASIRSQQITPIT